MTSTVQLLNARVSGVEADEGPYGPRYTWRFETDSSGTARRLRTWTSRHLQPGSRASGYVKAITGRAPMTAEDVTDLIGYACTLEVAPNARGYLVVRTARWECRRRELATQAEGGPSTGRPPPTRPS